MIILPAKIFPKRRNESDITFMNSENSSSMPTKKVMRDIAPSPNPF